MTVFHFLVLSRSIYFAAAVVLFGAPLFWFVAGSDALTGWPRSLRATVMLLRFAAPVAALSGIAWLIGILANMAGGYADVVDAKVLHAFFFETQFGPVVSLRLTLLVGIIAAAPLLRYRRALFLTFLILGGPLLLSQAWLGHAAEGTGLEGVAMLVCYGLHMLASAAWIGGLPPLLFALSEARDCRSDDASLRVWALLSRYSLLAMGAVVLIMLSGVANAGFRVAGAFDKLFLTAYGWVLGAKVALVAVMLGFACYNRFVAMPRLRTAFPKAVLQISGLRTSVAAELALGIAVLAIAAILGIEPPPR